MYMIIVSDTTTANCWRALYKTITRCVECQLAGNDTSNSAVFSCWRNQDSDDVYRTLAAGREFQARVADTGNDERSLQW